MKDIQSKYSVNLLDPENKGALFVNSLHLYCNPTEVKLTSAQKLVSIICYQVAINVGDLERYREVQAASFEKLNNPEAVVPCAVGAKRSADTRMFLEARWWYLKAHQLHAKFGKPFHQLAIISQLMVSFLFGKSIVIDCKCYKLLVLLFMLQACCLFLLLNNKYHHWLKASLVINAA